MTDIALDNDIVEENISGAAIATISITDPDTVATFRNNTVTVNDSRFEVINNNGIIQLKLKGGQSLDYETEPTIAIALTATDNSNSSLTYSKNFTINVADRWVGYVTSGNIKSTQRWSWGLRDDSTGVIVGSGVCDSATAGRKLVEGLLRGAFLRR